MWEVYPAIPRLPYVRVMPVIPLARLDEPARFGSTPTGRIFYWMARARSWKGAELFTIGHSTRSLDELVSALRAFGVSIVADIRTVPRSRHNPQFNGDSLSAALGRRGLRYVHLPQLGGLRHARADSPNAGWHSAGFRGFADYMLTEEFEAGLERLNELTGEGTVAFMCAEAVPWRCHRSLVADALLTRGAHVQHIMTAAHASPHRLTPFARTSGERVIYPADSPTDESLVTPAPFHLQATVRVLQRRPSNLVDVWEGDAYRRVLPTPEGLVLAEVRNHGTVDRPDVRARFKPDARSASTRDALLLSLRRILGLDVDPAPLLRLARVDGALRPTVSALRGMRPPRFSGLFEIFANVVPFQQVSLDAGISIVRRMVERLGERLEIDGRDFYAFPTAEKVAQATQLELRGCGMSGRKADTLQRLAALVASGTLTEEAIAAMSTREALATLEELPGIGPWSAGLVLLRGFGRLDVFPVSDVGVRKGLNRLRGLPPETPLGDLSERAGGLRGYLYFCALGSSLLEKGLIDTAPAKRGR